MTTERDKADVTGIIRKVLDDDEWLFYRHYFSEGEFEATDIIDRLCHEIHALRLDLGHARAILDEARRKGDIA